uniref:Putative secreted peptide n=1 Tax=Anopheles braziliensis TaxID=58242 RepID=A0A2M3ZN43_9DIPT
MLIVQAHALLQHHQPMVAIRFATLVVLGAGFRTLYILQKLNLVRSGPDALTEHHLTEVLHRRIALIDRTEIEVMVLVRNDRLFRVEPVHV